MQKNTQQKVYFVFKTRERTQNLDGTCSSLRQPRKIHKKTPNCTIITMWFISIFMNINLNVPSIYESKILQINVDLDNLKVEKLSTFQILK